jgi:hypothetical protein
MNYSVTTPYSRLASASLPVEAPRNTHEIHTGETIRNSVRNLPRSSREKTRGSRQTSTCLSKRASVLSHAVRTPKKSSLCSLLLPHMLSLVLAWSCDMCAAMNTFTQRDDTYAVIVFSSHCEHTSPAVLQLFDNEGVLPLVLSMSSLSDNAQQTIATHVCMNPTLSEYVRVGTVAEQG